MRIIVALMHYHSVSSFQFTSGSSIAPGTDAQSNPSSMSAMIVTAGEIYVVFMIIWFYSITESDVPIVKSA